MQSITQSSLNISIVHAGFPSPAKDFEEKALDLNKLLIKNQAATFFVRSATSEMSAYGIFENDILIVDRSIKPRDSLVCVVWYNGEFLVRQLNIRAKGTSLASWSIGELGNNLAPQTYEIDAEADFYVWGVVVYVIHNPVRLTA